MAPEPLSTVPDVISASRFVIDVTAFGSSGSIMFSELAGISSEVEPAEYMSAGRNGVLLSKQFGKTKPATVTLKRGVDQDATLWVWHQKAIAADPQARQSCSLILQDAAGQTKATYRLLNAWPSKLDVQGLKAGATEIVMATCTLVCDEITFVPGLGGKNTNGA
ncbi:phage tail protein [Amycolatopsis sp. WQ 127309]|uniref:phage tail protein n=1 Tax=Amycolatopsis sp. WQ 127309 TaxID=2932773 RepID=UPI001FF595EA|nr:phage tail protein [Amycolatopsis sp. WQ 127309]UOZ05643.1 phage tail protein [Amycolatopsis sp. WQ 127309]